MKIAEVAFTEQISSIKPNKPQTPEQQRVAALTATADRAKDAVKAERKRQQLQKATARVATLQRAGV